MYMYSVYVCIYIYIYTYTCIHIHIITTYKYTRLATYSAWGEVAEITGMPVEA